MFDKYESVPNVKFSREFLECSVIKLSSIIDDNNIQSPIQHRIDFQKPDFALDDVDQGFYFHPFGKVIDGDGEKFFLVARENGSSPYLTDKGPWR